MLGYNIAVSIIAIMIGIGGIVYGVGYAMDSRKLKDFGMTELQQSLINGVIVGVLVAAFAPHGLIAGVINGLVGGQVNNLSCSPYTNSNMAICFANDYLVGTGPVTIGGTKYLSLLGDTLLMLIPLSVAYAALGIVSSLSFSIGIASISLGAIFHPLLAQLSYIIEALSFAMIGIYAQSMLLKVIAIVAMPLMLPVGIVLRTFYFTRRLGGAVMAIAIGLFAVFPLTYLFDAQIASDFGASVTGLAASSILNNTSSFSGTIIGSTPASSNGIDKGFIGSLLGEGTATVKELQLLIQTLTEELAVLVVEVFFVPVLSVALTIISIRELARVLGSEVSFGRFDIF